MTKPYSAKNARRRNRRRARTGEKNAQVEIEPIGHFLTGTFSAAAIPMANYETGFYDATLSDSDNFEQWEEKGSKDAATRAYDR